jgi:hypothetical protein
MPSQPIQHSWASDMVSPPIIVGYQMPSAHPILLDIPCPLSPPNILGDEICSAHPYILGIGCPLPTQYSSISDVCSTYPSPLPYLSAHPIILDIPAEISWPNNLGLVSTSAGPLFLGSDGLKGVTPSQWPGQPQPPLVTPHLPTSHCRWFRMLDGLLADPRILLPHFSLAPTSPPLTLHCRQP